MLVSSHTATPGGRGARRRHRVVVVVASALGFAGSIALVASGTAAATTPAATHAAAQHAPSSNDAYAPYYSALTTLEHGAAGGSITEQGSTLFFPLFSQWAARKPLGITVATAGTGSGAGKTAAENGTSDIGASDAYLLPSDPKTVEDIPVVVSAQEVAYNVPGLPLRVHLRLNAPILNAIYSGAITSWNNKQIVALNKSVLPAHFTMPATPIVPIHRSDSSGDTFLFTSYLSSGDAKSFVESTGPSTAAVFPNVAGALAEKGNEAMFATCEQTKGCIAYIGSSYLRGVQRALGVAALLNGFDEHGSKGTYVTLSAQNVLNEMDSYRRVPNSGVLSMIDSHAARFGYPIVNFEYAIVNTSNPHAADLKALLAWGMDPRHGAAASLLSPYFFHPLPPAALGVAIKLLNEIR